MGRCNVLDVLCCEQRGECICSLWQSILSVDPLQQPVLSEGMLEFVLYGLCCFPCTSHRKGYLLKVSQISKYLDTLNVKNSVAMSWVSIGCAALKSLCWMNLGHFVTTVECQLVDGAVDGIMFYCSLDKV